MELNLAEKKLRKYFEGQVDRDIVNGLTQFKKVLVEIFGDVDEKELFDKYNEFMRLTILPRDLINHLTRLNSFIEENKAIEEAINGPIIYVKINPVEEDTKLAWAGFDRLLWAAIDCDDFNSEDWPKSFWNGVPEIADKVESYSIKSYHTRSTEDFCIPSTSLSEYLQEQLEVVAVYDYWGSTLDWYPVANPNIRYTTSSPTTVSTISQVVLRKKDKTPFTNEELLDISSIPGVTDIINNYTEE